MKPYIKKVSSLLVFIGSILAISSLIGWITAENISGWYSLLNKPSINPPSWVFGPVWTVLYLMIAVSGWLIYQKGYLRGKASFVYFLQLLLNFSWSFLFFICHQIGWAFLDIILLWLAIIANIFIFYRYSRASAFLLLPYFVWVGFAGFLNFNFWLIN